MKQRMRALLLGKNWRRVFRRHPKVPDCHRQSAPFVLAFPRCTVNHAEQDLVSAPDAPPAPTMVDVIPRSEDYNIQRHQEPGEEDEISLLKECPFERRRQRTKKRTSSSLSPLMPDEIMEAILLRLPVRALVTLRSVCRSWRTLLSGYDFATRHIDLAKRTLQKQQRVLLFMDRPFYTSPPFMGVYSYEIGSSVAYSFVSKGILPSFQLPYGARPLSRARVQHCDGLILFAYHVNIYVCNPSINQVRVVPPGTPNPPIDCPNEDVAMISLGFDSFAKAYKLVKCFYHTYELIEDVQIAKMRCEVFTLCDSSHSWVAIAGDLPFPVMSGTSPVFYNGFVCWKINCSLQRSTPLAFLSLCLKDDRFEVIPPPSFPMEGHCEANLLLLNVDLAEINGNLCAVRLPSEERHITDIWRLDEGCSSNHVWTRWYSINIPNLWKRVMPVAIFHEKILFQTSEGLGYFDLVTEEFENIIDVQPAGISYSPEVGAFVGSWYYNSLNFFKLSFFLESLIPLGASLNP